MCAMKSLVASPTRIKCAVRSTTRISCSRSSGTAGLFSGIGIHSAASRPQSRPCGRTISKAVPPVVAAAAPLDPDYSVLQRCTGTIKNVSFLAFWIQLALSLSSAAVLIFSVGVTQTTTGTLINVMSLAGVVLAFISTFFAFSLQRIGDKLAKGLEVKLPSLLFNLNATNTVNLMGIASAVIGLQAAVGTLVGKTLMTQPQFGVATAGNSLVSLDVFSLQALTNTLMAHFIALIFGSILNRSVTRASRT